MNKEAKLFEVDSTARAKRRRTPRTVTQTQILEPPSGERLTRHHEYETTLDDAETRQVLKQAAQSFIATVEFYKSEYGGSKTHEEALDETLKCHEWRRNYVEGLAIEEMSWGHLAAVAEVNTDDLLQALGTCAADDDLQCGKRGAKETGEIQLLIRLRSISRSATHSPINGNLVAASNQR